MSLLRHEKDFIEDVRNLFRLKKEATKQSKAK